MTERPVIGISCYVEDVDRNPWVGQRSAVLPIDYVRHIESAGGLAVILPPRADADDEMAGAVIDRLDGLVLSGGADIGASAYGAQPDPTAQPARIDRDAWESALARVSAARGVPTLGICRGMQIMAVAAGGTLEQHIPDRTGTDVHSPVVGAYAWHPVSAVAGTRLAALLGDAALDVPTYHHQAVADHPGYVAAARHPDGTLEAMEDPQAPFRLAVQWHPEGGEDARLFDALVAAARVEARSGARSD